MVRVITAVVSVMGGAGILAYLAAWILIPAPGWLSWRALLRWGYV